MWDCPQRMTKGVRPLLVRDRPAGPHPRHRQDWESLGGGSWQKGVRTQEGGLEGVPQGRRAGTVDPVTSVQSQAQDGPVVAEVQLGNGLAPPPGATALVLLCLLLTFATPRVTHRQGRPCHH